VGSLEGVRILDSPPSDGVRDRTSIKNAYTIDLRAARILLVEDGDTNRKLISLILRRAGARVTTASNGKIGVDLAIQTPFDLILMDMQMPIMDGYTATMQLRQHGVEAPIVALTAHAMKGDSEKCTQAGCTGYLTKPVDADELLYVVAEKLLGIAEMFPVEDAEEVESVMEKAPVSPSTRSTEATLQTTLSSSLPVEDPDFREIVEEFVERLAQKLAEMNHAVSANEMQSLWELAHWLKGAGGTAGFQILTEWAIRLGDAAKSGQTESAREIVAGIAALAARIEVPTGGPI
jgi:CheY-like chemotaxis protein